MLCGEVLAIDPGLEEQRKTRKHSSRVEGSFTRANTAFTTAHDGGESADKVLLFKWRMILRGRAAVFQRQPGFWEPCFSPGVWATECLFKEEQIPTVGGQRTQIPHLRYQLSFNTYK